MPGFDPISWLSSALQAWERGSLFLWALGVGTLSAVVALSVTPIFAPTLTTNSWFPALTVAAVVLLVLAGFKTYQERTIETLVFIADDMQSFWNHAPQPDGRKLTQIALRGRVTNKSDKPIYPADIELISPRTKRVVQRNIFTEHEGGRVYGSDNAIAPGARAGFSAHFFADSFIGIEGKPLTIVVSIKDQLGHRHKVRFRNLSRPQDR
jgi:hypothetical protein